MVIAQEFSANRQTLASRSFRFRQLLCAIAASFRFKTQGVGERAKCSRVYLAALAAQASLHGNGLAKRSLRFVERSEVR